MMIINNITNKHYPFSSQFPMYKNKPLDLIDILIREAQYTELKDAAQESFLDDESAEKIGEHCATDSYMNRTLIEMQTKRLQETKQPASLENIAPKTPVVNSRKIDIKA